MTTGKIGKKIYKKIKKNSAAVAIVFFVLSSILAIAIWCALVSAFFYYIMESKVSGEYKLMSYRARLYENADETAKRELKDEAYLILDAKGEVVESNTEDTRIGKQIIVNVLTISDSSYDRNGNLNLETGVSQIYAYSDEKADIFSVDTDGDVNFSLGAFGNWVNNAESLGMVYEASDGKKTISFPLWILVKLKDPNLTYCGKATVDVNLSDALFLFVFAVAILFVVVVLLVVMFVNAIGSIITQARMNNIFFMDMTTKGHNWMWFIIRGEQQLLRRKYRKYGYAVLDVVFVKYRNYCVCHTVEQGEAMLRKVNDTISDLLLKGEVCSHYASANFAVLIQYKSKEELKRRLDEMITKLEDIDSTHKFGFHIGVDYLELPEKRRRKFIDLEKEYNNACAARATLDESDDSGIAFFGTELVEEQKWLDMVQENQQRALDNEEFLVYYQPKYDPKTNQLKGAEALIRWDSPTLGFCAPGTFIPIFEKNGFIVKIDRYMLIHVAKDQKRWYDEGLPCVPVSVNVSRAHFIESDLAEKIRDLVDEIGTPHDLIEIELTESAFFDDKKALISTITRLRNYGFLVSMDDFGSGYSSLNSLKDMPLDVLKLDAEFFHGDLESERGEIVISEAIKLAKNLKMQTVAEGVESKEQVDFLARQGCDMIQGFVYAKPMPGDDYAEKIRGGRETPVSLNESESASENPAAGTAEEAVTSEGPAAGTPGAEAGNNTESNAEA